MRYVPSPEDCRLLYSFDDAGSPRVARWNAIIGILYATGAGISELAVLTANDIIVSDNGLTTITFAGRRRRAVPVHSHAIALLKSFLAVCPRVPPTRLFDWNGHRLWGTELRRELINRSHRLGLPAIVTSRDLRFACIRDLLASGMPAEAVAQLLGVKQLDYMVESVRWL